MLLLVDFHLLGMDCVSSIHRASRWPTGRAGCHLALPGASTNRWADTCASPPPSMPELGHSHRLRVYSFGVDTLFWNGRRALRVRECQQLEVLIATMERPLQQRRPKLGPAHQCEHYARVIRECQTSSEQPVAPQSRYGPWSLPRVAQTVTSTAPKPATRATSRAPRTVSQAAISRPTNRRCSTRRPTSSGCR